MSIIFVTGCVQNGFVKHYQGSKYDPIPSSTPVYRASDIPHDARQIGASNFVSSNGEGNKEALAAARKIGAHGVVWKSEHYTTTSSSGAIPISTPTSTTSYHSGSVWGSGGSANYSGTSTTRGTSTTYIPYTKTHHWYKYHARFYRKNDR
jgi:hypothetical protein